MTCAQTAPVSERKLHHTFRLLDGQPSYDITRIVFLGIATGQTKPISSRDKFRIAVMLSKATLLSRPATTGVHSNNLTARIHSINLPQNFPVTSNVEHKTKREVYERRALGSVNRK